MVEHVSRKSRPRNGHRMHDVILPHSSGEGSKKASYKKEEPTSFSSRSIDTYDHQQTPFWLFVRSVIILLALIAIILFVAARLFGHAQVDVRAHVLEGDINILARTSDAPGSNIDLVYETMEITREKSQQFVVEEFITGESRASGTLVIFNEEPREQRLREETRFETPEGLIFMLGKGAGITVPAAQGDTPGSAEATVYAAEAGQEYNIQPTDFVIPGWREINDNRFTTQYARSKGSMTGGGSSTTPVLTDEQKTSITQELQNSLREQMIAQAWVDAPDDFVFFENAVDVSFSPISFDTSFVASDGIGDTLSTATISATLSTLLFNEHDIAHLFTQSLLPETDNQQQAFDIVNPSAVAADIAPTGYSVLGWREYSQQNPIAQENEDIDSSPELASLEEATASSFRIRFTGTPKMVAVIKKDELIKDLVHMPAKTITTYFASLPQVDTARVSVRPFWRKKLPKKEKIDVFIQ